MENKIDLVYLWVDGNDPKWLERKQKFSSKKINTTGRYQDNNELKYSLRSVEKHLPWIRKIFIVTDNQIPPFINIDNPKIKIVDHSEIIPKNLLPTFNSVVIEYFIHKIPDLSEHFIYSNDDMYVNENVKPSFFFKDGLPIIRMKYDPFLKIGFKIKELFNLRINNYRLSIKNAIKLVEKKYHKFYPVTPHHNIDCYLKSDYRKTVEEIFEKELQKIFSNRFRDKSDIQRILIQYDALVRKRGHLKYVKRNESCRITVHKDNYEKYISKYQPQLFCLNDTEHATDEDRSRIVPFLEKLYPKKSSFEK
jgi:hypothetical protein